MAKHLNLLEGLVIASHKNTELLHDTYFRAANNEISDEDILKRLSTVSDDLTAMQTIINHHLKTAKQHR